MYIIVLSRFIQMSLLMAWRIEAIPLRNKGENVAKLIFRHLPT
jgi:hypothetical protein